MLSEYRYYFYRERIKNKSTKKLNLLIIKNTFQYIYELENSRNQTLTEIKFFLRFIRNYLNGHKKNI